MTNSRLVPLATAIGLALLLAACAAGINDNVDAVRPDNEVLAGFWRGLWHGIISPITFIISLFTESVNIYEIYNTGGWYDFGFVLGAGILFGGGFLGIFRGGRKRWD
jgi:hypothetical protein